MGVIISVMILAMVTGIMNPVAAASSHDVDSSMSNSYIQGIIDSAGIGDTINFLSGTYNNISLSITKSLNLVGNGATLIGNSTINAVISAANANGVNINGFNIIGNGSQYGIDLNNVTNSSVVSNNISNTSDTGIEVNDKGDLNNVNNVSISNNRLINTSTGVGLSGSGFNITNNYMDMMNGSDGISGSGVFSTLIQNNTISNTADAISVFSLYQNLTINKNTISNATLGYGDGISLVNCGVPETVTSTTITNNIVDNSQFGIFLGGYFTGNVYGNSLNDSSKAGMNITGKMMKTTGSLNANITNNNITNGKNIGVSMENPSLNYLYFDYNNINSTGANIAYNQYYRLNGTLNIGYHNNLSKNPTYQVSSKMNNSQIQSIIDNAGIGDTVEFLAGVYSNISLSITKSLNLISDGAILNGTGTSAVININGNAASGTNMSNFTINGNGSTSAISVNNAGNLNISNNSLSNSAGGIALSSGYYNVNLKDNIYSQVPYHVVTSNSGISDSGSFTDPSKEVSNIAVTSSYASSSITNGQSTTYTVKVSNNGKGAANSVKLNNIISSAYGNYKIVAVSRGSYDSATGTWNVGGLSSGSDAMIMFTVTSKKAGSLSVTPSASYTDNSGAKSVSASSTALTINKDVKMSYTNKVSSSKVKKGKYVTLSSTVSNSGKDKSDAVKVKITVPKGMKLISVNHQGLYNKATKTWTFTVPAGKKYTFTATAKVTSKGTKKVAFNDNGKIQYKYIKGY